MSRSWKNKYKVSRAERQILQLLRNAGFEVIPQFAIPGLPFLFDFYLPKYHTLLEYNGTYYHADPRKYPSGTLIKMAGIHDKVLVDYIWSKDQLKYDLAHKYGYRLVVLWEEDFKATGFRALMQALNVLR